MIHKFKAKNKSILKGKFIWYGREVNSSKAYHLYHNVMKLHAECSPFYTWNCQLTETMLGGFNKRGDGLNIRLSKYQ